MKRTARHGWLIALFASVLALFAGGLATPGDSGDARDRLASHAMPTVHADRDEHSTSLRGAPSLQLVSVEQRAIMREDSRTRAAVPPRGMAVCAGERARLSWCDVVQCRRSSGAVLLRYATPPPALHCA